MIVWRYDRSAPAADAWNASIGGHGTHGDHRPRMPHVDGRTVAVAVTFAAPDVAVILLTGWGHRLLAENDLPPGADRVLSKPPKLAALRLALAELVTSPPP
jgi:hypothetical protein